MIRNSQKHRCFKVSNTVKRFYFETGLNQNHTVFSVFKALSPSWSRKPYIVYCWTITSLAIHDTVMICWSDFIRINWTAENSTQLSKLANITYRFTQCPDYTTLQCLVSTVWNVDVACQQTMNVCTITHFPELLWLLCASGLCTFPSFLWVRAGSWGRALARAPHTYRSGERKARSWRGYRWLRYLLFVPVVILPYKIKADTSKWRKYPLSCSVLPTW